MKEAKSLFDTDFISDHLTQSCVSIGDLTYKQTAYNTPNNSWGGPDWFWYSLTPPKKIKLIDQVKAVDIQTVIGNAGGYVGLFLGKYF